MNAGTRVVGALIGITAFVVSGCGGGASSADSAQGGEFTLRIGATSVTGTPAGSLGWGDKEEILADELASAGVTDIEYSFFQSGKDVVAALLSGAVDVAAVGDNPALTAKGNGADLTLLALDSVNGDTWLIGAKAGPTTIEGLAGKDVTAPQGTIRDRAARQLIDLAGLTGRIEVKDVPTPESIAGLSSGSVDATLVGDTGAVDLANRGFPVIDKTSNHRGIGSTGATVALTEFVDAHPGFTEAWQDAVTATNSDIAANLGAYTEWVAQIDGVEVELVREATKADTFNTEPFPDVGVEQLQSAHDFLHDSGAFETPFDVRQWIGLS
ncbi:ABC transporter substrate-binding protein [Prauserella cavernicola]|uniref:ABC transporter substrate-binding protein n=1 Tax=Prauserella cavernicola TaxID=2800127 RepID=A0A934QVU3_9PSEU|nr:ABC transporter substrate-binding protein [Prauserella cavernicola]MBK1787485.1 ABC transporter substrate-binding protein [Prauserella cavernicola]